MDQWFEIRDSPLGGQGLFAKKFILKNTLILIEEHITCIRNFNSGYSQVNSYFDYPELKPFQGISTELVSLGAIVKKLDQINEKYGNDWLSRLSRTNNPKDTIKTLTYKERQYIVNLCIKYQPKDGIENLIRLFDVIFCNSFQYISCKSQPVYMALDWTTSKFNRSYQPNCQNMGFPKYTTVNTMVDIQIDIEFTIYYGQHYFENLGIKCKCGKCNRRHVFYNNEYTIQMIEKESLEKYISITFAFKRKTVIYILFYLV